MNFLEKCRAKYAMLQKNKKKNRLKQIRTDIVDKHKLTMNLAFKWSV